MRVDADAVWVDAHLATMASTRSGYAEVHDGAIAVRGDRVVWSGARSELPRALVRNAVVHESGGRWITPGLIDCHTHIVHAGHRAHEFEQRLNGVPYEAIARAGGGIASTVRDTRAANEAALISASLPRLRALLGEGVTTVEVKSGYGLDLDTERRILRVARTLSERCDVTVRTTYLGAHAVPPEFTGRREDYLDFICSEVLPALAIEGLVDAVDAFCDTVGFTLAETERVLRAARALGLDVKLHAEQLSDQGGAALAARYGALSADHLEHLSIASIAAMAEAGTVAVLLPAAYYFLRDTHVPPVEALRRADVPIALATDCNPGTSPTTSLLLVMNMACTLFRLTPEEALAGVTRNAARALGLADRGVIRAGSAADFVLWDIDGPGELAYRLGYNPCHVVVRSGRIREPAR